MAPLLMLEVWDNIMGHLKRPTPPPMQGVDRAMIRQPDLATMMRTSVFFNNICAPILYEEPIIDHPCQFIYGVNLVSVHPGIPSKHELTSRCRKLHIEYPELYTPPTYNQLLKLGGAYWDDVGLQDHHHHCPPEFDFIGPPESRTWNYLIANRNRDHCEDLGTFTRVATPVPLRAGEHPKHDRDDPHSSCRANGECGRWRGCHDPVAETPFPNLRTLSLCSILGHPHGDFMPRFEYENTATAVRSHRQGLWKFIESLPALKHVCAHNGTGPPGLPWDEVIPRDRAFGPPFFRLHLDQPQSAPSILFNGKTTWDLAPCSNPLEWSRVEGDMIKSIHSAIHLNHLGVEGESIYNQTKCTAHKQPRLRVDLDIYATPRDDDGGSKGMEVILRGRDMISGSKAKVAPNGQWKAALKSQETMERQLGYGGLAMERKEGDKDRDRVRWWPTDEAPGCEACGYLPGRDDARLKGVNGVHGGVQPWIEDE